MTVDAAVALAWAGQHDQARVTLRRDAGADVHGALLVLRRG